VVPFEELNSVSVRPPRAGLLGGWQFAVKDHCQANSRMAFLIFPDAAQYGLEHLDRWHRRQVRKAISNFEVRRVTNPGELVGAYDAYLDFYRRTRYAYRADRVRPERFAEWAEAVFRHPKSVVLAAFAHGKIEAVAVCQPVEDTLIYAAFFSTEAAFALQVGSLMLHAVRTIAAQAKGIQQVFAGMRKVGGQACIDEFHLQRGCKVVVKPAWCRLNPIARITLRLLSPQRYAQLLGVPWEKDNVQAASSSPHISQPGVAGTKVAAASE